MAPMDKVDERRRDQRRVLPFGRTAVLEVAGKSHIVSLVDVSRGGAYLGTRLQVTANGNLWLKLLLPRSTGEVRLACQLVRQIRVEAAGEDRPPGVAVRFRELDADVASRLEEFVVAGGFRRAGEAD